MDICVRTDDKIKKICIKQGESLMEGLIREGFYISAPCGGNGRCGKCKVKVLSEDIPFSSEDIKIFTQEEISKGYRLSCTLYPKCDIEIDLDFNDESEFETVSKFAIKETKAYGNVSINKKGKCSIAIDIGTTTIAFLLLDESGKEVGSKACINRQRKYGADVITRIKSSVDGKGKELQDSICNDLKSGILSILLDCSYQLEQLSMVAIACNTTMSHLLMGYDCESLGMYPYKTVNIDLIEVKIKDILELESDARLVILPGISAYVGGDIVSGLYACDFFENEEISMLVDLGTNGEMAIGNKNNLMVTSVAAGPAFEGGNIKWGIGSVSGAICSVSIEKNWHSKIKTIKDGEPVGICGTGVIEAISEMLREEIIDETGLLMKGYFEKGFPIAKHRDGENITITQKDIREVQLAKSAIRAGMETLIKRYGITKEEVSKVYLAGGFGYRLDVKKAIDIGMLPKDFLGKVFAVGNSSLEGAKKYLLKKDVSKSMKEIVNKAKEIDLAMDDGFNELYMEYMLYS